MPELPEVECVRLSLERLVVGRRVAAVRVIRPDVICGDATTDALLGGDRVERVIRHGKQLALVGHSGLCVCIHLGMSGQLCVMQVGGEALNDSRPAPVQRLKNVPGSNRLPKLPAHTHVLWQLDCGQLLRFTDPRRFGGVWTFSTVDELRTQRWSALGPDALTITPARLHDGLSKTHRPIKAALLDQQLIAGLGNIYVDELLYSVRIHPLESACLIDRIATASMVRRMRTLLKNAIHRGGSSLRDYVDAESRPGSQQDHHRVYGRSGLPCTRRACRTVLASAQIAGRTTVWCPGCQVLRRLDEQQAPSFPHGR